MGAGKKKNIRGGEIKSLDISSAPIMARMVVPYPVNCSTNQSLATLLARIHLKLSQPYASSWLMYLPAHG